MGKWAKVFYLRECPVQKSYEIKGVKCKERKVKIENPKYIKSKNY